jgi:hypothetical protein
MNNTLPHNAHAGQRASFYYGARDKFRLEFNAKGDAFRTARANLEVLIGDVDGYIPVIDNGKRICVQAGTVSNNRFVHTAMYWAKVLEGVDIGDRYQAIELFNITNLAWNNLQTYIKGNYRPRVNVITNEIHKALKDCEEDTTWDDHNLDAFELVEGKLKYKKPKTSEASIFTGTKRWLKQNPDATEEEREAIQEALAEAKQQAHGRPYWDADLAQIVADIPYPDLPDPFEDFTTYTEVDEQNEITVVSNTITATNMQTDVTSYVSDDKGVGSLGDVNHLHSVHITSSVTFSTAGFWAIHNTLGSLQDVRSGDALFLYNNTTADGDRFFFYSYLGGVSVDFDLQLSVSQVQRWVDTSRSGTTATSDFYTDVDRTTLDFTLSITCDDTLYRYVTALFSSDAATASYPITIKSMDLDLQEALSIPSTLMTLGVGHA